MRVKMSSMQAFAQNVWIVDGPNVRDFGVLFPTRMTVVKLANGSVWVDSPVSVPFDTLERITDLGDVRYLVAAAPGRGALLKRIRHKSGNTWSFAKPLLLIPRR